MEGISLHCYGTTEGICTKRQVVFLPACRHEKKILMTALLSKYRFDKSGV